MHLPLNYSSDQGRLLIPVRDSVSDNYNNAGLSDNYRGLL